ncbi:MAG: hypothetical protein QM758_05890 [Armatimonas sp.]
MTPEQAEQWRSAINPLDYFDFHAVSAQGLRESTERLQEWGVPGWAIQLRGDLAASGWKKNELWVPEFALRSEVALVGIQVLHRGTNPAPVYRQLFVRFVGKALRPIVEWVLERNDSRLEGYTPLIALQAQCEKGDRSDKEGWNALGRLFKSVSEDREIFDAYFLALELVSVTRYLLDTSAEFPWESSRLINIEKIVGRLNQQHQWRLDGKAEERYADGPNHRGLIAQAYLAALEAECPPPDWLIGSVPAGFEGRK